MHVASITVICVFTAILFGLVHDQVTVRICLEYFTIGHPAPPFPTESPTFLAIQWGVIATWWYGLFLGLPYGLLSRLGSFPKLKFQEQYKPVLILMGVTAAGSLFAGLLGYLLAKSGAVWLVGDLALEVPVEKHIPFLTDLWAHSAAYLFAGLGGLVLWGRTIYLRYQLGKAIVDEKFKPVKTGFMDSSL